MASVFKRGWDVFSGATTVWGVLPSTWQTGAASGLGLVTTYFGFHETGVATGIFLGTGVFAFVMAAAFFALRTAAITQLFQRLSMASIGVSSVFHDKQNNMFSVNLVGVLRNDSQRPMFYRLKRAHVQISKRAPASNAVDPHVIIIPPGGYQPINFATVEHIPLPTLGAAAPAGVMELEVSYGPSADKLDYLFHYGSSVQVVPNLDPHGNIIGAGSNSQVTVFEHTRS